jgi:hypothetical protein
LKEVAVDRDIGGSVRWEGHRFIHPNLSLRNWMHING